MTRRRGLFLSLASTLAVCLVSGVGHAKPPGKATGAPGPKDKVALKLDDEALGQDYLETNFIRAEKKLQQAIAICARNACSPRVLAQIHRDLAVVHMVGLGKVEAGKADLKTALELDPSIELDPNYATPDLKKAFDQIRGVKTPPKEEPKKGIGHTPVTEQAVATPIPIFATFGGAGTSKLRVWYKGPGAERWASVNMEPKGSGLAAEIPCNAAAKAGDLQYFIEALGEEEETIDKDGSRTEPHTITIKNELEGEAPHLPDESPPERCTDVCTGDDCAAGKKGPRNNWFSISIGQDLAIVGSGTNVCAKEVQVDNFSCFRDAGSQYIGNPLPNPGDNVKGGLAPATTRILIGYDRVLVAGLTLGVRLGYVLRGMGPRADGASAHAPVPFHVEGRLAYWFGTDVFSTKGVRPFLFAAGGLAQVDTHFNVTVDEDPSKPPPPAQTNPPSQHLDAYRRMGQGFAGGGAGVMYAFTPGIGLALDVKYMRLFPTAGNVLAPELSFAVGF